MGGGVADQVAPVPQRLADHGDGGDRDDQGDGKQKQPAFSSSSSLFFHPRVAAVVLVSPSYHGVVGDVGKEAEGRGGGKAGREGGERGQ